MAGKSKSKSQSTFDSLDEEIVQEAINNLSSQTRKSDHVVILLALVEMNKQYKAQLEVNDILIKQQEARLSAKDDHSKLQNGRICSLEKRLDITNEKLVDLTSRSMDKNVIIIGLTETHNEDLPNEVNSFFKNQLKIEHDVEIDVCHRNGPIRKPNDQNNKPRPITVMMRSRSDKNYLISLTANLKGTPYSVIAQRPEEIRCSQSILFAQQKRMKARNPNILTVVSGEKLINKSTKEVIRDLKQERNRCTDIDQKISEKALKMKVTHTGVVNHASTSKFQGHALRVTSPVEIRPALARIKMEESVSRATHNVWAMRLPDGREWMCDDGEFGSGRHLLETMRDQQITGTLLVVTRWYGGHMGAERFRTFKSVGAEALAARDWD